MTPYFHAVVPDAPEGVVAAEVEILERQVNSSVTLEARIISVLAGPYVGMRMHIQPEIVSSCDAIPSPGDMGLIVGRVLSSSDGLLVVDPIRAPSLREGGLQERPIPRTPWRF